MLHPLCDLEILLHPWPWSWICKVTFWNGHISGIGGLIDVEQKGCESIVCWWHCATLNYNLGLRFFSLEIWPHPWPWPWILKVNYWNKHILGTGGLIDMQWKWYEMITCWTSYATLNCDLDLGFWKANSKMTVSQEWEGRLTWNERDVSW